MPQRTFFNDKCLLFVHLFYAMNVVILGLPTSGLFALTVGGANAFVKCVTAFVMFDEGSCGKLD